MSDNDAFGALNVLPSDPLLGIMAAFRADDRADKVDLGVGVYKNDAGVTPVMAAVREAERRLVEAQTTKVYEGLRGNVAFCDRMAPFILGDAMADDRLSTAATPGGSGAVLIALHLAKRAGATRAWVSNPSWPNHRHMAETTGLAATYYRYRAIEGGGVDFTAMTDDLAGAAAGDLVILQGPCHNPTGLDLSLEQWSALAELCVARGLVPLVDTAYHGLGDPLEEDLVGVRAFIAAVPTAVMSYSCSKNFGLYRERAGLVLVRSASAQAATVAASHIGDIARAHYSMPPAHGPAIVETILGEPTLERQWREELDVMRARIQELREKLAQALAARTNYGDFSALASGRGMFAMLPMQDGASARLSEDSAVYMPASGRINIAGLKASDVERVADILAPFIAAPSSGR